MFTRTLYQGCSRKQPHSLRECFTAKEVVTLLRLKWRQAFGLAAFWFSGNTNRMIAGQTLLDIGLIVLGLVMALFGQWFTRSGNNAWRRLLGWAPKVPLLPPQYGRHTLP